MPMRVIIRFSVNHESNSALRNKLRDALKAGGLKRTPRTTGTYEGRIDEGGIEKTLARIRR